MQLPDDTLISHEKLTQYLLVLKKRNDKSQWLVQAGYILTKGDRKMTYRLFEEVVLTKDIPKRISGTSINK